MCHRSLLLLLRLYWFVSLDLGITKAERHLLLFPPSTKRGDPNQKNQNELKFNHSSNSLSLSLSLAVFFSLSLSLSLSRVVFVFLVCVLCVWGGRWNDSTDGMIERCVQTNKKELREGWSVSRVFLLTRGERRLVVLHRQPKWKPKKPSNNGRRNETKSRIIKLVLKKNLLLRYNTLMTVPRYLQP